MPTPPADKTKVFIGRTFLYLAEAPGDEAARDALIPDDDETFDDVGDWTYLGALLEGLELNETKERYDVRVDAVMGPVISLPLNESMTITGSLVDIDLERLADLAGTGEPVVTQESDVGQIGKVTRALGGQEQFATKAIGYEGVDQRGFFYRGILWENVLRVSGGRVMRRGQEMRVPFESSALSRTDLQDDPSGLGAFGMEQRKTAAALAGP
jgi:hypothetical protein